MRSSWLRRVAGSILFLCGAAVAAPFASVPSVAAVGRPVAITGGGFEPGSVISVRVIGPGKAISLDAVVVGADGTISHTLIAARDGAHRVQLIHADGRTATSELTFTVSR
jgi:hypothetical protein